MLYHLSEEQAQIKDMVSTFLGDQYDAHAREAILSKPGSWSPEIWHRFAEELGILGLTFPEEAGGLGGGSIDAMLLMDAAGEALVVEPLLETCVIGATLLRQSTASSAVDLMTAAVQGEARFALAFEESGARFAPFAAQTTARKTADGYVVDGRKAMVVCAPSATHIFFTAQIEGQEGIAIFVAEAEAAGLDQEKGRTIDGKGVSQLRFEGCSLPQEAMLISAKDGAAAMSLIVDSAIAAICAEAVGIMRRLVRETVDYLAQRRQFGHPLIDFQVLQHRLADMHVQYELAQAMAYFAAGMVDAEADVRSVNISAAKVQICSALRAVAQEAVQMHGAMGITDELAIGHLFKRATALENEFGAIDYHLEKVSKAHLKGEHFALA